MRTTPLLAIFVLGALVADASDGREAQAPAACEVLARTMTGQPPGPAFIASYPTVTAGPLGGAAFLYDNAVATVALIACNNTAHAERIGEALLAALDRDRYWHDGRLRNGYRAGAVGPGPVKLAGWWDAEQHLWMEDRYQVGSDTGNMAWAILALLALDRATDDHRYRDGAQRLGGWIRQWRNNGGPGGFTGGTFAHEPAPIVETWKSTEHNTDLFAAFTGLARATGDQAWLVEARAAEKFVRAMWRTDCACFAAGTGTDGETPNTYLALDAQTWPLLAIPEATRQYEAAMAPRALRVGGGFAYSEAQLGLWTEGTAQVALLLALAGRDAEAAALLSGLHGMRTPGGAYYAAEGTALATGFMLETDPTRPRQYFHLEHLAAVSWVALAEARYNPFTNTKALPGTR